MPRMIGEVQPQVLDSMIAKTRLPNARITRVWPTGSNRRARAARDSGTNKAVQTIAAATIGTLTQKIERQPKLSTRTPPTIGPSPSDSPETEANTPIARARSAGSRNVLTTIAIATGLSIVPPTACTTRAAISHPMLGARPHSIEPTPNPARPIMKIRRRPYRSAVEPASTRKLASTSVYASTVHCSPDTGASRSRRSAGSATLTMEMSITTTRMLAQQIASTRSRRRWLSSVISVRSGQVVGADGSRQHPLYATIPTLGFRVRSKSRNRDQPNSQRLTDRCARGEPVSGCPLTGAAPYLLQGRAIAVAGSADLVGSSEVLDRGAVAGAVQVSGHRVAGQDRTVGAGQTRVPLVGRHLRVAGQGDVAVEPVTGRGDVTGRPGDPYDAVRRAAEQLDRLGSGRPQPPGDGAVGRHQGRSRSHRHSAAHRSVQETGDAARDRHRLLRAGQGAGALRRTSGEHG